MGATAVVSDRETDKPAPRAVPLRTTKYRLDSAPTGETFEFAASARTSADKTFRFVWTLAPGKTGPGHHFHETETEVFEVVSGTIRIWLAGVARDYGPGEVCVAKAGVPHRFLNATRDPVVINVSLDGPRMEDALVPVGVASHGRGAGLGDMLRMFAGLAALPSTPVNAVEKRVLLMVARGLAFIGFKPYPPVIGWDADAS